MLCKVGQKGFKINATFHPKELAHTPIKEKDLLAITMFFEVKTKVNNTCLLRLDNKMGIVERVERKEEDEDS